MTFSSISQGDAAHVCNHARVRNKWDRSNILCVPEGKTEGEKMLITFPNKICNMLAGCQPPFRCLSLVMDNDNRHDSTATRCRIRRRWTGDRKLNISAKSYLAWSFFSSFSLTAEGGSSRRPSWRFGSDTFPLLGLQWNYSGYASSLQNASHISLAALNISPTLLQLYL